MKAKDALIAWTPYDPTDETGMAGRVEVGPLLQAGDVDWTKPYSRTGGAKSMATRDMTGMEAIAMLFIEFNTLVVRDGIDPDEAHRAFLVIDEYAEHISPDMEGARHPE